MTPSFVDVNTQCCPAAIVTLGTLINNGNTIQGGGIIGAASLLPEGAPDPSSFFINRGSVIANNPFIPMIIYTVQGMTNHGTVRVANGSRMLYVSPANYVQTEGTTQVDGVYESTVAAMNIAGGTLTGNGTIMSDVFMNGTLNPGVGSPGTLTITGNYQQLGGGALTIEMNSMLAGTGHDQLVVGQQATLSGALNIILASGFLPQLGDAFMILLCGSCSGTFQHINNANFAPGLMFVAIYNANDVTLLVSQTPEPGTLVLLGTGLCAIFASRRRRGNRRVTAGQRRP